MKKTIILLIAVCLVLFFVVGDDIIYECNKCEKKTVIPYYDINFNKESVLCGKCAKEYWEPIDYKIYRIKRF